MNQQWKVRYDDSLFAAGERRSGETLLLAREMVHGKCDDTLGREGGLSGFRFVPYR